MAKLLPLTHGLATLVDDADHEALSRFKWSVSRGYAKNYAQAKVNGKRVLLHRYLMDAQPGFEVDHINGDSLDNRRENLRVVTRQENLANRRYGSKARGES